MVMYVVYNNVPKNSQHISRKEESLWVGQSQILQMLQNTEIVENIIEVQADGNELEFIIGRFTNLPYVSDISKSRVQRWFGDHAKFIIANLKYQ